jgi:hypothetical protein
LQIHRFRDSADPDRPAGCVRLHRSESICFAARGSGIQCLVAERRLVFRPRPRTSTATPRLGDGQAAPRRAWRKARRNWRTPLSDQFEVKTVVAV